MVNSSGTEPITMKKLLTAILCACQLCALAQKVVHHAYTTYYNPVSRVADSVVWDLTPAMVSCPATTRHDVFAKDPAIAGSAKPADYRNSGYDKGHLFSYADAQCDSADRIECFYMTNMLPQIHPFNAGDWKTLETQERVWAQTAALHILAGGTGSLGRLPAGENIPAFMWKAIWMNGKWTCWIMPNQGTSKGHSLAFWEKPLAEFNQQTGLHLR